MTAPNAVSTSVLTACGALITKRCPTCGDRNIVANQAECFFCALDRRELLKDARVLCEDRACDCHKDLCMDADCPDLERALGVEL